MQLPEVKDTFFEDVEIGQEIPTISMGPLSHTHFLTIASSHHDWYPGHHDVEYAREQGLPDIFMNTTWQCGLFQRALCAWGGPNSIPRRVKIKMGRPIVRYETVMTKAIVTGRRSEDGEHLVDLDIWMDKIDPSGNEIEKITTGSATVVLPSKA